MSPAVPILHRPLILHQSTLDLFTKTLRSAIASIPRGLINLEDSCHLIIQYLTSVPDKGGEIDIISLAHGYHFCDFERRASPEGIVLRVNPPYLDCRTSVAVRNVNVPCNEHHKTMLSGHPSFEIEKTRFVITSTAHDLDKVVCDYLDNLERYSKPQEVKYTPDPNNPDKIPF